MGSNRNNLKRLRAEENALFCSQTVMLLKAGVMLHDGMKTLSETYRGTRYEERFRIIDQKIRQTGSLADAVAAVNMFPVHITQMLYIGEKAGLLEEVLETLDWYFQREAQVRRAVKNAVLYPLIMITMIAVVIGILSIRVMPIFTQVYQSLGAEASISAEATIRFGSITGQVVLAVVAVLLAVVAVLFILLQTKQKERVKALLLKLFPAAKRISRHISIARFSAVLSKLMASGFPVDEAVSLVVGIIPDREIALKAVQGRDDILKGVNLADALIKAGIYEDLHTRMLKVAGLTGNLDQTIRVLGELYDDKADEGIRRIVSMIEPAIVGVLAVIIGAILLAVMLPLASILSVIA